MALVIVTIMEDANRIINYLLILSLTYFRYLFNLYAYLLIYSLTLVFFMPSFLTERKEVMQFVSLVFSRRSKRKVE